MLLQWVNLYLASAPYLLSAHLAITEYRGIVACLFPPKKQTWVIRKPFDVKHELVSIFWVYIRDPTSMEHELMSLCH